jgi:hypothetical protein
MTRMGNASEKAPAPHHFTDQYQFEADFHGETLTYLEGGRKVGIGWTWTNGYKIYQDSIAFWTDADGIRTAVSDQERAIIIDRAVKYAKEVQNVKLIVEP